MQRADDVFSGRLDVHEPVTHVARAVARRHPEEQLIGEIAHPVDDEERRLVMRVFEEAVEKRVEGRRLSLARPADEMEMLLELLGRQVAFLTRLEVCPEMDRNL